MISVLEVQEIHATLIDQFGGAHGLRDIGLLESALARPFQIFDGKELYPTPQLKSAALLESLLVNHPFVDGNKRIGYTLLRYYLLKNNLDIAATEEEKYDFIISVASGDLDFHGIAEWIVTHTQNDIEIIQ